MGQSLQVVRDVYSRRGKSRIKSRFPRRTSFWKKIEREVDQEIENQKIRHRPESLSDLVTQTNFNRKEVQALYRSFKENCPNGLVTKEQFQDIFAHFFYYGDSSCYATLVFDTFDEDGNGKISFDEFVHGLSVLLRGTERQKLTWVFELYDCQHRGYITKHDLFRVIQSVYNLMGSTVPPIRSSDVINHVEEMFGKLDKNGDGRISKTEFVDGCVVDEQICQALELFSTIFLV